MRWVFVDHFIADLLLSSREKKYENGLIFDEVQPWQKWEQTFETVLNDVFSKLTIYRQVCKTFTLTKHTKKVSTGFAVHVPAEPESTPVLVP